MSVIVEPDAREIFRRDELAVRRRLESIFGNYPDRIQERHKAYLILLEEFERIYGKTDQIAVVRSPARINLKGVHIDHRGGYLNYMAIDREIAIAVSPRDDDTVLLHDQASDQFKSRSFSISQELPLQSRGNWASFIEQVSLIPGDWSNYVRAAILKLQDHFSDRPLRGMNLLVNGNIPLAAGLSSSSALVVAACEACLWTNDLTLSDDKKALLCGEGEWYVGTRGGSGDHAAMVFGRRGHLNRVRFFPLSVEPFVFPTDYKVVVCNSLRQAQKANGAKSIFNERVATYELAMLLIKQLFPNHADRLTHLRDLNTEHLGINEARLYKIVAALPERITQDMLYEMLPTHFSRLNQLFRTHDRPKDGYRVRAVCLFGIAECERSRLYADALHKGDMATVSRLMYLSHEGDRIVSYSHNATPNPVNNRVTDTYLNRLMDDVQSGDPVRENKARLWQQPGGYACSCEELDELVDIARTVPGVVGANLTGAGLGGCVVTVVQNMYIETFLNTMHERYYIPKGLEPSTIVCTSVEGAGRVF